MALANCLKFGQATTYACFQAIAGTDRRCQWPCLLFREALPGQASACLPAGQPISANGLPIAQTAFVTGAMWLQAHDTLNRICDLAGKEEVVFTLENLISLDHPGRPFASSGDVLALVSAINRPELRINLDLYHTQIGEGDLVRWCEKCLPWIGEVQVGDNPGRCEPGTGEIAFAGVARALHKMGYSGPVGLEAYAAGEAEIAIEAFRTAFTI